MERKRIKPEVKEIISFIKMAPEGITDKDFSDLRKRIKKINDKDDLLRIMNTCTTKVNKGNSAVGKALKIEDMKEILRLHSEVDKWIDISVEVVQIWRNK